MNNCDKCKSPAIFVCCCRRCNSEPEDEEKFYSCKEHQVAVMESHDRIRGYAGKFYQIIKKENKMEPSKELKSAYDNAVEVTKESFSKLLKIAETVKLTPEAKDMEKTVDEIKVNLTEVKGRLLAAYKKLVE